MLERLLSLVDRLLLRRSMRSTMRRNSKLALYWLRRAEWAIANNSSENPQQHVAQALYHISVVREMEENLAASSGARDSTSD